MFRILDKSLNQSSDENIDASLSILPILSFAQNSGSDGELLKLELKSEGTTANLIFTFTNPITGEEASFEAEDVPFDGEHGFYDTFELRLKNSADSPEYRISSKTYLSS